MGIFKSSIFLVFLFAGIQLSGQDLYHTNNAVISFISVAPLETIQAESSNCQGIVDMETGEYAFRVFIKTFEGFNNRLQQIHFNENYLESEDFPESVFNGFVVEPLDNYKKGERLQVRAKGNLLIHGISKEQIIHVTLEPADGEINFNSEFEIALADYNISIPPIVKQKIAENIKVSVSGTLERK